VPDSKSQQLARLHAQLEKCQAARQALERQLRDAKEAYFIGELNYLFDVQRRVFAPIIDKISLDLVGSFAATVVFTKVGKRSDEHWLMGSWKTFWSYRRARKS
jgi:hypothetical protein